MKKTDSSAATSIVGIIVFAVILILGNWLLGRVAVRADLTQDKRYSLSQGSKEILGDLAAPVAIRFYFSEDSRLMPEHLKLLGRRVTDLLTEYEAYAGDMVTVEVLNPEPATDAEETAQLDGIRGQPVGGGESLYLGIAITSLDETETLPVLDANAEDNLEYDLTRAIYRVTNPEKIKVGMLSSLPVMGSGGQGASNPFMRQQQEPAWLIVDQLRGDYDVVPVDAAAETIPSDLEVLIVHHPKDLGEGTLYAIDQFILAGGKVVAMLDPSALMDRSQQQQSQFGFTPPSPSTLGKLLDAWGVEFDTGKVVADRTLATPVQRNADGSLVKIPAFLSLNNDHVNPDAIAVNRLDQIRLPFAGAFTGKASEGLEKTSLLTSTANVQLIDAFQAQQRDSDLAANFEAADAPFDLAIRLTGTFKTAFPDGKPGSEEKAEGEAEAPAGAAHLAESAKSGAVVLIGDADFVHEQFWAQRLNMLGQQMLQIDGDNGYLLLNLVEHLSGNTSLISIRSRGITNRPLTKITEMSQAAADRLQEEKKKVDEEEAEAAKKINELLQAGANGGQRVILSPETQAELEKLRDSRKQLVERQRELERELRKDIDLLEARIMAVNIGLMPLVVILLGIGVALIRRQRRAAHQKRS